MQDTHIKVSPLKMILKSVALVALWVLPFCIPFYNISYVILLYIFILFIPNIFFTVAFGLCIKENFKAKHKLINERNFLILAVIAAVIGFLFFAVAQRNKDYKFGETIHKSIDTEYLIGYTEDEYTVYNFESSNAKPNYIDNCLNFVNDISLYYEQTPIDFYESDGTLLGELEVNVLCCHNSPRILTNILFISEKIMAKKELGKENFKTIETKDCVCFDGYYLRENEQGQNRYIVIIKNDNNILVYDFCSRFTENNFDDKGIPEHYISFFVDELS